MTMRTRATRLLLVGGVMVAFGAGLASAAVPGADGVINGCYEKRTGLLRVIDAEAGKRCTSFETPISWDAGLGPKVASLEASLADEKTARLQATASLQFGMTALEDRAQSQQANITALEDRAQSQQANITSLGTTMGSQESHIGSLDQQVRSLQTQANEQRQEYLNGLGALNTRITNEHDFFVQQLAAKQAQIDDLVQRVTSLEEALVALQGEVAEFKEAPSEELPKEELP